ncbi:MAG: replicative DNA helicase [candidate division WOR-3 bacterium]|uniref:Replicative DNA helicase n=1 Tax=candidate division WOR-3 bacterium TaxID=2052148 RepID=A0A7C2A9P8_UNCW3|nr:replicative DNA helicase [candidate division WOR-3 bacterium]
MSTRSERGEKKPPQALEAEAAVLGAILIDQEALPRVMQFLKPDHFYSLAHRRVYEAMLNLFEAKKPYDIITVADELRRMKELDSIGGQPFLSALQDTVLTSANCEEHAQLVLEKALQRQLIQTATEIVQDAYNEEFSAEELLEKAESKIFQLRQAGERRGFTLVRERLLQEMDRIEQARTRKQHITGVETGFLELDDLTSGFQPGDFIIIAGRPGMGKTAFALNIAVNTTTRVKKPVPVAIFSLEMSTDSLIQRLICAEARVTINQLRRGMLNNPEYARIAAAVGRLSEAKLYIDDSAALNALEIRARARRLKGDHPDLGLIIIDYLQLMEPHSGGRREYSRQQEITEISRALKAMAKELNIPVIALSQLSRAPDRREDKKPLLSDLRESGALEQDADVVIFLYRDAEYNKKNWDALSEEQKKDTDLIIAKHRNGPTRSIKLVYLYQFMRFENIESRYNYSTLPEDNEAESES